MVAVRRRRSHNIVALHHFDKIGLVFVQITNIRTAEQQERTGSRGEKVSRSRRLRDDFNRFFSRSMANLLSKFRLDYSSLTMVYLADTPKPESQQFFDTILEDFKEEDGQPSESTVSDAERASLQDKTNRHLRLRELLFEYSSEATLIVM